MYESMSGVTVMLLVAGLELPLVASALAVSYSVGSWFYLTGYADVSKDAKTARYTKPLAVCPAV